jgi:hypothetical protein
LIDYNGLDDHLRRTFECGASVKMEKADDRTVLLHDHDRMIRGRIHCRDAACAFLTSHWIAKLLKQRLRGDNVGLYQCSDYDTHAAAPTAREWRNCARERTQITTDEDWHPVNRARVASADTTLAPAGQHRPPPAIRRLFVQVISVGTS